MWQWGHRCVTDRWIITGGGDGAPSWGAVVSGGREIEEAGAVGALPRSRAGGRRGWRGGRTVG
jgi:hypothetical protein